MLKFVQVLSPSSMVLITVRLFRLMLWIIIIIIVVVAVAVIGGSGGGGNGGGGGGCGVVEECVLLRTKRLIPMHVKHTTPYLHIQPSS